MTGRLAEWRTATGPGSITRDLYPLTEQECRALREATIRHCCGCVACCDAYESPLPCDRPGHCSPEHPCLGRVQARQWGERHLAAGCRAAAPARQPRGRWEPYEDELLRACPSLPDAEAMLPDRSRQALICRARHLGHHLTYRKQETAA